MSERREELAERMAAALAAAGYELVALKLVPGGGTLNVRVLIDHLEGRAGVSLGDCSAASKAIQSELNLDLWFPGRYVLEVSSPGVDRPLTRPEHYRRFQGEAAVVRRKTSDPARQRVKGRIAAADHEGVTLELVGGEAERLTYAEIESARLEMDPWPKKSPRQVETEQS
jgi:ribosome maturation factor RimP